MFEIKIEMNKKVQMKNQSSYIRLSQIKLYVFTPIIIIVCFLAATSKQPLFYVSIIFVAILLMYILKNMIYKQKSAEIVLKSKSVYIDEKSLYVMSKYRARGFKSIIPNTEINKINFIESIKIGCIYHHVYHIFLKEPSNSLDNPIVFVESYLAFSDPIDPKSIAVKIQKMIEKNKN